jgi:hypothetical protein
MDTLWSYSRGLGFSILCLGSVPQGESILFWGRNCIQGKTSPPNQLLHYWWAFSLTLSLISLRIEFILGPCSTERERERERERAIIHTSEDDSKNWLTLIQKWGKKWKNTHTSAVFFFGLEVVHSFSNIYYVQTHNWMLIQDIYI